MTTTSRLERATARPLRPLNRPGVHAQEERPFQAQSGKQTSSLFVCALDMVWGKQPQQRNWRRPYTVCGQCTRWIWTDRIPARPVCECGCKFPNHGHKARQGGKTKQSAAVEALPTAAHDLQGKMRAVLQSFIGTLPRKQKEQFLADFAAVSGKKSKKGDSDPYQKVSASCAEAFRNCKRLAEKKRAIESKASKLQEQLEKLSEDLARTTAELEEAQEVHDRELKSYASVVQQGSGAQGCNPIPPFDEDDDLASSTTGDEEDMDTRDKFSGVSAAAADSDSLAAATPVSSQPAATAGASSSSAAARQPAETEEFRAFKQGLSEEHRDLLDKQLQQAAQQKKPTAKEAKDLMDTARLMAGFVQAFQTTAEG